MSAIAQLKALLGMDNSQYKASMKDSERAAGSLQRALGGVGRMIAGAFTVTAITRAATAALQYADNMQTMADNTGITTGQVQALNVVAKQNNMEVGQFQQLLGKLAAAQYDVTNGNEKAADAYKRMGISLADIKRLNPAQLLEAVARAAGTSENAAGLLADVFGDRLGVKAVSGLRMIADEGLANIESAAIAAGSALNKIDIQKLADANDQLELMKNKLTIIAGKAVGGAMKWFQKRQLEAEGISPLQLSDRYKGAVDLQPDQSTGEGRGVAGDAVAEIDRFLAALDKNREKLDKAAAATQGKIDALQTSVKGRGINADSLAQVGGFVGTQRAGLSQVDKQIRIAEETKRLIEHGNKIQSEILSGKGDESSSWGGGDGTG